MDIVEAVNQRKSIRAFKPDAVPLGILKRLMEPALRAPSWANTQPWEFAIVSGSELEKIRKGFIEKAGEQSAPDIAGPPGYPEPHDSRRRALTAKLYEIKGIQREDAERRAWWRLQGLKNFGSPAVIYICIERSFYFQGDGVNVWPMYDCGLVAENIMLVATAYGLGAITQAQAVSFPDVIRKVLKMPDSKLIVMGLAIGYPDWSDPINQFRSEREPLDNVARWYGFDSRIDIGK